MLGHHVADYSYDPAHEYGPEMSTDPDYPADGVDTVGITEDGEFVFVSLKAHYLAILIVRALTRAAHGILWDGCTDLTPDALLHATPLRGLGEHSMRFPEAVVAEASRTLGRPLAPNKTVRCDAALMPYLPPDDEALCTSGQGEVVVWRMDRGAPVPPLVVEILSRGHVDNDLELKRHLYAAAGIPEYYVFDLGGQLKAGSSRSLMQFLLNDDTGAYGQTPVAGEYHSPILEYPFAPAL